MSTRSELLSRVVAESQRHYAAYTLFNQAMADHLGLHTTDLQCIALLDVAPDPVSTGDIARLTGLTSGAATRLVDRMAKAGLVERHADPHDRRRSLVTLTPEARSRIGAAWETPGTAFGTMLDGFSDAELEVIDEYLRRASLVGRAQAAMLGGAATSDAADAGDGRAPLLR